MKVRTMYIRNTNGRPCGAVVITVSRKHRKASYQLSVVHPVDTFDNTKARLIALQRLVESPLTASIKTGATMHDISTAVMKRIASSNAPNRAVKFAKVWLKTFTKATK